MMKKFILSILAATLAATMSYGAAEIYADSMGKAANSGETCSLWIDTAFAYLGDTTWRSFSSILHYGIVGKPDTNTVPMVQNVGLKPNSTDWDAAAWTGGGGFTTPPVPNFVPGDVLWYYVVYTNICYGSSTNPALGANNITTVSSVKYVDTVLLDVKDTWTAEPPVKYQISGKISLALGLTSVKLAYALDSTSLAGNPSVRYVVPDAEGNFLVEVPADPRHDTLFWRLSAVDSNNNETVHFDLGQTTDFATKRQDRERIKYYWTGNGDGTSWTDTDNWGSDVPGLGYPGTLNYYYWSTLLVSNTMAGAVIDLEGGTYAGRDQGGAMIVAPNIPGDVKFKNGTWGFNNNGSWTLGANGTTLIFENVNFINKPGSSTTMTLSFRSGSTTVFEGATTGTWIYRTSASSRIIVRNGSLTLTKAPVANSFTQNTVAISNAVWSINSGTSSTVCSPANRIYLVDGPDHEAQFITTGKIKLNQTYNIEIPMRGHSVPFIQAATLNSDTDHLWLNLDVTKRLSGKPVPIVKFTSTTKQTAAVNQKLTNTTFRAYADGVDVTAKRNAQLYWDADKNTIYFKQDYQEGLKFYVK